MRRCLHQVSRGDDGVASASALALVGEGDHARRRQGEYVVHQRRTRARATVSCPPLPVVSGLHRNKSIESRPGLEFAAIRRKCFWPESPSENPSIPRILGPEKHHVAFEFAEGRSTEFVGGRRTFVEPSNIADGGYTRGEPVVDEVQMFKVSVQQLHFGCKACLSNLVRMVQ
ncbi:uncharacterized protein LOC119302800 [Triticum dicoccoides]|uniref:uncharacterized protein LOC119302800 n=1 Tax=Triticum dicoccoides TaxID=85692 RepID=UPI00188DEAED|nr:uncharacterized protein LOC119302800 [Triticum dicoccoides]